MYLFAIDNVKLEGNSRLRTVRYAPYNMQVRVELGRASTCLGSRYVAMLLRGVRYIHPSIHG